MFDLIIRNITQRKIRTGLTVFGIALGIFAVVVMGGMSEYFNLSAERGLNLISDKIYVMSEGGFFGGALDESNVREIRRVPGVSDAYGLIWLPLDIESIGLFGDFVVGIEPEKQEITLKDIELKEGRLLLPGDSYSAVVGSNVAREFDLEMNDELEIESKRFRGGRSITYTRSFNIVGILEFTGTDFDYIVAIPLDTAQKFYDVKNTLTFIYAVPDIDADVEDLAKRIELSVEGVTTMSPELLRKQAEQSLLVISLITISSAVLAAIIGGLSIMNTMFMSVSERTREFGLMKAMGAEVKDILFLTVGEATLMGLLGGISGIAGGGIFIFYLNDYLASRGTVLFAITPRLIIIALFFGTLLGTLSGILPAYRAAKMRPMEAMRYG